MKKSLLRIGALLLSFVLAASTLLLTSGCAKKDVGVKSLVKNVFKYDYIDLPESIESFNTISYYDSNYYISAYSSNENGEWGIGMYKIAPDGTQSSIELKKDSPDSSINTVVLGSDGNIWYDDNKYSYDDTTQTSTSTCVIHKISQDGTELASYDMNAEIAKNANGNTPVNYRTDSNGGMYFTLGGSIYHIDASGNMTSAESGVDYINTMCISNGGKLYAMLYDNATSKSVLREIDTQTLKPTETIELSNNILNNAYSFFTGLGYDFCYNSSTGLMGFNIGDAEPTEICNWLNSDIPSSDFSNFAAISDTEFCAVLYDYSDNYSQKLIHLTKVPDAELTEKYVINLAVYYMPMEVRKQVVEFNRVNTEYRISVTDYSQYSNQDDWNAGISKLNNDIISGNAPDIMMISDSMPYDSYVAKGLFIDLGQYLDSDPDIKRDDLLANILDMTTTDGKLTSLITQFSIRTVAAKSSTVNGTDGMNMDEFNAAIAAHPDATAFWDVTQDALLEYCSTAAIGQFIDRETGKCSFDTPDFVKILEFAKTLSKESVYDSIDWNDVADDFWNNIESAVRDGRVLFEIEYLGSYDDYWNLKQGKFNGDFSLVGFPCESRDGSSIGIGQEIAISSKTKFSDACWQFVRTFLLPEYQDSLYNFPIRLDSLEKLGEKAMQPDEYDKYSINYNDAPVEEAVTESTVNTSAAETTSSSSAAEEKYEYHNYYWIGNEQIDIGWPDQSEIDYLTNFIKSVNQVQRTDDKIQTIIKEEASVYFAGQKSAEETAKIIQNRISTYVAESR